jgi:hypothetical protein
VLAGTEEEAGIDGWALAVLVTGADGRGSGEREEADADGVGLCPAWRARAAAWRGGTVTTAGAMATAISAGLAAQAAVPAAPHPAAAACGLAVVCPDAGLAEKALRAR